MEVSIWISYDLGTNGDYADMDRIRINRQRKQIWMITDTMTNGQ